MANAEGGITILQLTDSHILPGLEDTLLGVNTNRYFQKVLAHAFAGGADFDLILLTGDLAQEPCAQSYRHIRQDLSGYAAPAVCLPGNHDDYGLMRRIFNDGRINCQRRHIFPGWQLICLNSQIPGSAKGRLASSELEFLRECLRERPDLQALIAMHHHCLPTGSAWMDTMIIQNSADFLKLADEFPQIKTVTTGHIHQVMDTYHRHIRVLGAPSTCFQFQPHSKTFAVDSASPGYRIIELCADGHFDTRVIRLPEPAAGLQFTPNGY